MSYLLRPAKSSDLILRHTDHLFANVAEFQVVRPLTYLKEQIVHWIIWQGSVDFFTEQ